VGVILDKSRLQGVIKGTAAGEVVLEKVMTDEQVSPGDLIVTSGGDQIFPKGLTVGTVMKVSPGADLFLNIRVKPSANLSRLEEVLVITKKEDRAPSLAETNSVRAVDILTQRLPSVPDKPAADANQPVAESPASAAKPSNAAAKPPGNAALNNRAGDPAGPAGIKPAALQKPVSTAKKAVQQTSRPVTTAPATEPPAAEAGTTEDKPH
jgi:rod shape-determining protein MreC